MGAYASRLPGFLFKLPIFKDSRIATLFLLHGPLWPQATEIEGALDGVLGVQAQVV